VISKAGTGVLAALLLLVGGCAPMPPAGAVTMPTPSAGDVPGRIMSVRGTGFTICGVTDDGVRHYDVTVCGSLDRARSALAGQVPASFTVLAYKPGDGGGHTAKELVMEWWVDRTTGPGFTVTSTSITEDGTIEVGVDGDLGTAKAVLDREFPGFTRVHAESQGNLLVARPTES
jgi:hypothetical protein